MAVIPKIELSRITKSFDANHVLKGINLTVAPQESLVIIGTSGCGKSVLMKCLNGLITPDQGSIKIDGQEILGQGRAALEDLRRRFGMTFQLIDDAIDYSSNLNTMGKNIGDDFKEGKITLPIILAYGRSNDKEKQFWQKVISKPNENVNNFNLY